MNRRQQVCLWACSLLLVVAVAIALLPVTRFRAVDCGSAVAPERRVSFSGGSDLCRPAVAQRRVMSGAVFIGALIIGAGGYIVLRTDSSQIDPPSQPSPHRDTAEPRRRTEPLTARDRRPP